MISYHIFNNYLKTLYEDRKKRLKLRQISITADMLHDSANIKNISFDEVMQTDFILCLRSILHSENRYQKWYPRTLVYKERLGAIPFELFSRAESRSYFEIVCKLLKVESYEDLITKFNKAKEFYNLDAWTINYDEIPFELYMNTEKLYKG